MSLKKDFREVRMGTTERNTDKGWMLFL